MDIWLTVSDTRNVWSKSILPTQKYYLFLDFMAWLTFSLLYIPKRFVGLLIAGVTLAGVRSSWLAHRLSQNCFGNSLQRVPPTSTLPSGTSARTHSGSLSRISSELVLQTTLSEVTPPSRGVNWRNWRKVELGFWQTPPALWGECSFLLYLAGLDPAFHSHQGLWSCLLNRWRAANDSPWLWGQ